MKKRTTIYLDDAASTPVAPQVIERLTGAYKALFANPSSLHGAGVAARAELERSRRIVARFFGVLPREIHFTSGATESNNLAISGVARSRGKGHILTVATEHSSVLSPVRRLQNEGFDATFLPVSRDGSLDLELLAASIRPDTFLISIMMVNNETGTLNPIQEIAAIARKRGVYFHCDATQGIKNFKVSPNELGVHLMSASGHKIYGPKGVGLLYVDQTLLNDFAIHPVLLGGPQEQGMRAGTENVPSICGLAEAFVLLEQSVEADHLRAQSNRSTFLKALSGLPIEVNGNLEKSVPSILNIRVPGVSSASIMRHLDHLQISAGSACSGAMPSHVLAAMGYGDEEVAQSFRISFGREISQPEVHQAAADIAGYVKSVSQ